MGVGACGVGCMQDRPWGRANGTVTPGPPIPRGPTPSMCTIGISFIRICIYGLSKGRGLSSSAFGVHVKPSLAGKFAGTHGHANRDSSNLESSCAVATRDAIVRRAGGDQGHDHPRCEMQASASAPYEWDPVIQYAQKPQCR